MLNRKTKRPKKDEGEENGLFQSDTLLEYQNKSLCTLVIDLREKLKSKEESYNNLSTQFNSTISFLNFFTSTINSLNDEITKSLSKNKISFDSIKEEDLASKKKYFSSISEFLNDLITKSERKKEEKQEKISNNKQSKHSNNKIIIDNTEDEEMKDQANLENEKEKEFEPMINLSKNITLLINNLLPILKLNEEQYEKIFLNADDELLKKNKELEDMFDDLNKNLTNYKTNLENLKSQNEINISKIKNLEETVETLSQDKFKLNRKLNTYPPMPLLVVEGYAMGKPVEQHDCICIVCGKNMKENQNSNNNGNNDINGDKQINKEEEEKKENEMNIEKENIRTNEEMEELIKENEALKKRIQELHENLEDISGKTEITEENILGSKHFQSLISQAENILSKLEKMKEINNNLQKENNSLNQKKENEILQISNSFNEQLEKTSQKLLEMSKTIEKNKTTIQLLMNKIESNENLLKEKDTFNINIFYDSFKKERETLIQKIEFLETQKKDYLNKYEDECLKSQTNQLNISLLRNEINNLKIIMNSNKTQDQKQYELNKEAIKSEQDKVELYKKEIERLKSELIKERKAYQNLGELNDMSQKNITELNTTIKNLKNKIDELNQNFSRVLYEKTESKQTISFLTEMKEVLEKKNDVYKEQISNYSIYTKNIEDELEMQKKLNNSLEEAKKLNEKDIEILKGKNMENLKIIDKEKMMKDDLQNKLNEIKNSKKKLTIDYDVLRTKYDDLCKSKQFDPNSIDVENISKENEVLKLENQKFREMVHCKVCKTEIKNVVITKCFHTFCKKCIDAAIESRKRRCPICRELISQNDVKKIFWD
jgi:DNA repair exonuclease SbcCD ATPase subunit